MVLRRVLALGVEVDTVLLDEYVLPGGYLTGEVRLLGGSVDQRVDGITLALLAHEWVTGGREREDEFHRVAVSGPFTLPVRNTHVVPFRVPLPWETPLSEVNGQPIEDQAIRVRTELALAGALDKSDSDPLAVRALPAQQRIIDALANLGFRYFFADLETGRLPGSSLPIWQEIEFRPSAKYRDAMNELELTFIAGPSSVDILLEVSKYTTVEPSFASLATRGSRDVLFRSTAEYSWLDEELDWESWVEERITTLLGPAS